MNLTLTSRSRLGSPRAFAVLALLALQLLLSVTVLIADAQPAAGHSALVTFAESSSSENRAPAPWSDSAHNCLFCTWLGAHPVSAPDAPVLPDGQLISVPPTRRVGLVSPPTPQLSRPLSRAPPVFGHA